MGYPLPIQMQKYGVQVLNSLRLFHGEKSMYPAIKEEISKKYEEMMDEYFDFSDIYEARDGAEKTREYFNEKLKEFGEYAENLINGSLKQ